MQLTLFPVTKMVVTNDDVRDTIVYINIDKLVAVEIVEPYRDRVCKKHAFRDYYVWNTYWRGDIVVTLQGGHTIEISRLSEKHKGYIKELVKSEAENLLKMRYAFDDTWVRLAASKKLETTFTFKRSPSVDETVTIDKTKVSAFEVRIEWNKPAEGYHTHHFKIYLDDGSIEKLTVIDKEDCRSDADALYDALVDLWKDLPFSVERWWRRYQKIEKRMRQRFEEKLRKYKEVKEATEA